MKPLLEIQSLTRRFGGLIAVSDVSFTVAQGEIFGVIGPNGAGKTTLFNVIAGHFPPSSGRMMFDGQEIAGRSSDDIARRGIGRTFQAVQVFSACSVRENLRRANLIRRCHGPLSYVVNHEKSAAPDTLDHVADFIGLRACLDSPADGLSYGIQKILGIGMALMGTPKLLLMDEPAAGLNPSEKRAMGALIGRLRDEFGLTILLVEHDMPLVMGVCDRIQVVNRGKPLALGTPQEIKADALVIDAYLGEDYEFA